MSEFLVSLTSIDDVRQFVKAATHCACDVDVLSGRYVVDDDKRTARAPSAFLTVFVYKPPLLW